MNFAEALILMLEEDKKIKLPDQDYFLSAIQKIFYDGDINRPMEILSIDGHVLRDDWEIIE